jgi:hypothetical protein
MNSFIKSSLIAVVLSVVFIGLIVESTPVEPAKGNSDNSTSHNVTKPCTDKNSTDVEPSAEPEAEPEAEPSAANKTETATNSSSTTAKPTESTTAKATTAKPTTKAPSTTKHTTEKATEKTTAKPATTTAKATTSASTTTAPANATKPSAGNETASAEPEPISVQSREGKALDTNGTEYKHEPSAEPEAEPEAEPTGKNDTKKGDHDHSDHEHIEAKNATKTNSEPEKSAKLQADNTTTTAKPSKTDGANSAGTIATNFVGMFACLYLGLHRFVL